MLKDQPIFIRHWLLSNKSLLNLNEFQTYMKSLKYPYFFIKDHLYISILDSIHYKVLTKEIPFSTYEVYISKTNQQEHSGKIYTQLIQDFDIKKMSPIVIQNCQFKNNKCVYIVVDGCHRLAIATFNHIPCNEHFIIQS